MSDPIKRAEPFLTQCGSCDAGLPMSCTCPTGDYRPVMSDLVDEVLKLRAGVSAWQQADQARINTGSHPQDGAS